MNAALLLLRRTCADIRCGQAAKPLRKTWRRYLSTLQFAWFYKRSSILLNAAGCKHNGQCDGRGKLGSEECIGKGSNRLGGGWSNTPELASAKFSNCCKPHDPAVTPPQTDSALKYVLESLFESVLESLLQSGLESVLGSALESTLYRNPYWNLYGDPYWKHWEAQ